MADDRPTVDETLDRIDRGEQTTRPQQRGAFTRDTARPAGTWERIRAALANARNARPQADRRGGR